MNAVIDKFWGIVSAVDNELSAKLDYSAAEPHLVELLEHVQQNPEFEREFESAFQKIFLNPDLYSGLIVSFCMHTLRYPSVYFLAKEHADVDPRELEDHPRRVMAAYSDDWRLAKLFDFYSSRSG